MRIRPHDEICPRRKFRLEPLEAAEVADFKNTEHRIYEEHDRGAKWERNLAARDTAAVIKTRSRNGGVERKRGACGGPNVKGLTLKAQRQKLRSRREETAT